MKFDGTNWVTVGMIGFSAGEIFYTSFAFNTSNEPYVAYQDRANSYKATVMKFNGTNWVTVGVPGFSAGRADYPSLAFSNSNEPYVAYMDSANSYKATVMKFDGTNWVPVGTAGFSAGYVAYTSLAFSSNNEPYVAFSDSVNSYKATVMKFDGTTGISDLYTANNAIGVYPNPAKTQIIFSVFTNVQLTNITGQIIAEKKNVNSLDISNQPKGIYFLTFTDNKGKVVQRSKIVKE